MFPYRLALVFLVFFPFLGFTQETPFSIRIAEPIEPDGLNPLNSRTASAQHIQKLVFQSLMDYNPQNLSLRPLLALDSPKIASDEQGRFFLEYQIRPQATWDNGQAVTAHDYLFTLKALFLPLSGSEALKAKLQFIDEIEIQNNNPQAFRIYCKYPYFLALNATATLPILPEHHYDKNKTLRAFKLQEISQSQDKRLEKWAKQFQTSYEQTYLKHQGSGPYKIKLWQSKKQLQLERKTKYWGDKLPQISYLQAYPQTIEYRFEHFEVHELRKNNIDIAYDLSPQAFASMINSEERRYYHFHSPSHFEYLYLGFNLKNPILAPTSFRQALAQLFNREQLMAQTLGGLGLKMNGPIHPYKPYHHPYLPDWPHRLERAQSLLAQLGWQANAQGKLEKNKEILNLKLLYPQHDSTRHRIALHLQEQAQNIGLNIELDPQPLARCIQLGQQRQYDLYLGLWVEEPHNDNLRQLWHSQSDTPQGLNRSGFKNPKLDALIEKLETSQTTDPKIAKYLADIQEIIHEEQPYVFLFAVSGRIAIHWRFDKVLISSLSPGFEVQQFRLNLKN